MPDTRIPALPPFMLGGSMWAIRPDALGRVLELARGVSRDGRAIPPASIAMVQEPPAAPAGPGIAVIPLTGLLTPFGSWLSFLFGGGSAGVQGFRNELARAVGDPEVAAIVLDVDSPGGSVGLIPEAAADVRAARDIKPVVAVANTQAASGAYYIASQASELYVTPSGMVGSIGVYYLHEDWSRANDRIGISMTYVHAGEFKVEGNPDEPLSDAAREAWQADADTLYAAFVADVALGRGISEEKVLSDFGQGRVLLAQDALDAGMVDGIDTLQAVIGRALTSAAASTGASARRIGHVAAPPTAPQAQAADPSADAEPPVEPPPAEPVDEADAADENEALIESAAA